MVIPTTTKILKYLKGYSQKDCKNIQSLDMDSDSSSEINMENEENESKLRQERYDYEIKVYYDKHGRNPPG